VTVGWINGLILANLMLRVYALYKLDSRVILSFVLLSFLKAVNVFVCLFFFIPNQNFTSTCIPIMERPEQVVIFMCVFSDSYPHLQAR
jgi:hypothetical protein